MRTACQTAKSENMAPCPCAAEWKFDGDTFNFCADPTRAGFTWCATETDQDGNYVTGKYARCTTELEEACQEAEDAVEDVTSTSDCPCLSGGQWSFDGERQSYCQQPNGLGKKPWCPTSETNVTSSNMASVSVAYCYTKRLRACQRLEGTRLPTQCPCVEVIN